MRLRKMKMKMQRREGELAGDAKLGRLMVVRLTNVVVETFSDEDDLDGRIHEYEMRGNK